MDTPYLRPQRPRPFRRARARLAAGFTVVEVMVATFVMVFGITSSILVIQMGFRALDTARNSTLASQILQSEMERIRLLPWDTTSEVVDSSGTRTLRPAIIRLGARQDLNLRTIFPLGATTDQLVARFTAVRTTSDVAGRGGEMKTITVTVTWTGIDGVSHSRSSSTQYAKDGLYDYYYTKASRT